MYVCTYVVRMYVRMYLCMYVCMYVYYAVGIVPGDPYIVTVDTSNICVLYISSALP